MKKILILLTLAESALLWAKPAGIFPLNRTPFLTELVQATIFNPQWSHQQVQGELLKYPLSHNDLSKYSAIIVLLKNNWPIKWQGQNLQAAENYLKQGGTFIFMDEATTPRPIDPVAKKLQQLGKVYWFSQSFLTSKTPYRQKSSRLNADWHDVEANMKPIHQLLLAAKTDVKTDYRELWNPQPLGPVFKGHSAAQAKVKRALNTLQRQGKLSGAPVTITAKTLIIVPHFSTPGVNGYRVEAARNLQKLLQRCAKIKLDYAYEHQTKITRSTDKISVQWRNKKYDSVISIGNTKFSQNQPQALLNCGSDGAGISIARGAVCLYGADPRNVVYAFAQDILGFRWLWPGELGEIVPQYSQAITLPPQYCHYQVPFMRRDLRNFLPNGVLKRNARYLGLTPKYYATAVKDSIPWFQRHKLRGSYRHFGGANFWNWFYKYGKTQPELFALQPDKSRIQQTGNRPRLCVSNPAIIPRLIKETAPQLVKRPEVKYLTIGPTDGSYNSFCMCENCRKLDPRQVPANEQEVYQIFFGINRPHYLYPSLSDRYLNFYSRIAEAVKKEWPQLKVFGLMYSCYRSAPGLPIQLPDNLKLIFVGTQYFNKKALQKDRNDWDRFAALTDEIMLRPNALYEGHAMPSSFVTELDRDLKHFYQTGMVGADYDAVIHHWATQGLNYYVLAELLWNPGLSVSELIADFCQKGFGAAAPAMQEYFQELEKLTNRIAGQNSATVDEIEDLNRIRYNFLAEIPKFYTPEILKKLTAILQRAQAATAAGSVERQRVEFFEVGLIYAQSTSEFLRRYYQGERRSLKPFLEQRHEKLMQLTKKYPFALHLPIIAHAEWTLWRDCGFEPWKNK